MREEERTERGREDRLGRRREQVSEKERTDELVIENRCVRIQLIEEERTDEC